MIERTDEERKAYNREKTRQYRARNPDAMRAASLRKGVQIRRRRYWLHKYKLAKGCCECGYNVHAAALDFDHIDPKDKRMTIMARLSDSLSNLMTEIRKCRVICSNCHRIHTAHQRKNLV